MPPAHPAAEARPQAEALRTPGARGRSDDERDSADGGSLLEPPTEGPEPPSPERVKWRTIRDVAMLVLGIGSLGIIVYDFLYRAQLTREQIVLLEWVDLGIVLVFVAEFVTRWRGRGWSLRFVVQNWFDIIGMVPLMATSIPIFRAFRLLRIVTIASRLLRMWSFVTGEKSAQRVLNRYRARMVEDVADLVMLRMLAMTEDIVARGTYARAMGDSLEERKQDIAAMAVNATRTHDVARRFAVLPGFEATVRHVAETTVDTLIVTLRSEEMQRTLETTLRGVLDQAKEEIARKNWQEMLPPEEDRVLKLGLHRNKGDAAEAGMPDRPPASRAPPSPQPGQVP